MPLKKCFSTQLINGFPKNATTSTILKVNVPKVLQLKKGSKTLPQMPGGGEKIWIN